MTDRRSRRGGDGARSGRRAPRARTTRSALPREVADEVRATARRGAAADALALLERAVNALERGHPAEAARRAAEAKSLAPRAAAIREVLGLAHYRAERFRDALRELGAYRRISGRADQNHLMADCHRALGAPEKAVPLAREALSARIPPEARAEAAVVGASALADLERYEEAIAILRWFRTNPKVARPHDLRVWYVLGDVLERAGRGREAAREFRRIVRHEPGAFDAAERLSRLS